MIIEIVGWIGSLMVIAAYGLNSHQKLRSDSILFYMLNITGGLLLVVYSIYKSAYANIFINVVWIVIALPALIKVLQKRN